MPAPDTSVKIFHSEMAGAPVLSGSVGALIAVLDAALVDGLGLKTVDSVVVAGGIATATISTGHIFETGTVVLVAGATPAGLNGEKRVLSHSATQYTYDATGISDQTATGTITAKLAPAGWGKTYSGTNKAAYKQIDVASSGMYLRVDDTGTQIARLLGYETMTDVDTGSGRFPLDAQVAGGLYLAKSSAASGASRKWIVVADSRTLYLLTAFYGSLPDAYAAHMFGDFISRKVGDAYGCMILANTSNQSGSINPGNDSGDAGTTLNPAGCYIARDYQGLAGSINATRSAATNVSSSSGGSGHPPYPSPIDGAVTLSRQCVHEGSTAGDHIRGELPGILHAGNYFGTTYFLSKALLTAEEALAGRQLMAIQFGGSAVNRHFVDVSGPWR